MIPEHNIGLVPVEQAWGQVAWEQETWERRDWGNMHDAHDSRHWWQQVLGQQVLRQQA